MARLVLGRDIWRRDIARCPYGPSILAFLLDLAWLERAPAPLAEPAATYLRRTANPVALSTWARMAFPPLALEVGRRRGSERAKSSTASEAARAPALTRR